MYDMTKLVNTGNMIFDKNNALLKTPLLGLAP